MTKRDLILIMVLVLIALASFAVPYLGVKGQGNIAAEISADGKLVQHIDLQSVMQQEEFSVPGPLGNTIVQIQEGRARIIESPCPDKICVRTGWIKLAGQTAICVPNRIILRIVSEDKKIDSISR